MGKAFATIRDFLRRLTSDAPDVSKVVQEGRRAAMKSEGANSLFAWPLLGLAKKIKGKESVEKALYEKIHRPLTNLDEKAGRVLAKHLDAPKLFSQVDVLPTSRTIGGNRSLIEHTRQSATAPIGKAARFATPLLATLYASQLLSGSGDETMAQNNAEKTAENKDELLKESSVALTAAHRRIEAEKLAFSMVEKGKIPPFSDYDTFQEKVASILEKDLKVVEEALDLDADLADMGKVASEKTLVAGADGAVAAFYHKLAEQ